MMPVRDKQISKHTIGDMTVYLTQLSQCSSDIWSVGKTKTQKYLVQSSSAGIAETFPNEKSAIRYISILAKHAEKVDN